MSSLHTLLVVGAGSSRAEALALGTDGDKIPPLDTDFFKLANLAGASHLEPTRKYLNDHYAVDIFNEQAIRMEEAFGLVYADTLTEPQPTGARQAFAALCKSYNRLIANTTNGLDVTADGPLGRLIKRLLEEGSLTIVTFNQDLLVERVLSLIGHQQGTLLWYPDDGYAMTFAEYSSPTGPNVKGSEIFKLKEANTSSVSVLKLHGSLNWYTRTRSIEDVPARLTGVKTVACTRRKRLLVEMKYKTSAKKGRSRWYTWPIIVPPIFEKGSFLGKLLAPTWNSAFSAISGADHIVVYGYSFPQADQQSQIFFKRAVSSTINGQLVSVINPDFSAAARTYEVLSPQALTHAPSVSEFLDRLVPIVCKTVSPPPVV